MKDTLFFSLAMAAERLVSFFILPVLTKLVSPIEYSIWSQSIVITGIMVPIILLGFQTAIVKFFPLWGKQENLQESMVFSMLLLVLGLFLFILIVALFFDKWLSDWIFDSVNMVRYVPLLLGLLLSEVLFEFLVAVLRATNRIRKISIYLLMKSIWRVGILIVVLAGIKNDFYWAFCSFVFFQFIITVLIYIKEINPTAIFKNGVSKGRHQWGEVLCFSLPLVPFSILSAINIFADRFFIANFYSLEELAIYSAAFSLAAIIAFIYSTLGFTLFPEISKRWVDGDKNSVSSLMEKTTTVYLSLFAPFAVFMFFAGSDFLLIITTKSYVAPGKILFLLSCNLGLFGLHQISFYLLLLEKNRSFYAPLLMLGVVIINISFNAILVPNYGLLGASIAGLFSNSVLAIISLYLSRKILFWRFPWYSIMKIVLRSIFMGGVILIGLGLFDNNTINLIAIFLFSIMVYGLLDCLDKNYSIYFTIIRPLLNR